MIESLFLDVDFNGIIIFDYPAILSVFNGSIQQGENILSEFTSTSKGDDVLDKGICLPIMGIHDGGYLVRIFLNEEPKEQQRQVIFSDKYFYLNVTGTLFVADMAVFWDWEEFLGWKKADVPTGMYKVCVEGVELTNTTNEVVYAYDLILASVDKIGIRDVEPRSDSRLY